ncbi:MAG TPA: VCBS repeat-containing protein, partial [Caldilineaceae bacterium]|nr:VCBS repeat-containing protein [Caldilineaceae bacterium]
SLRFGRAAVGQLKTGGAPEVVLVAGDTTGPLKWYERKGTSWTSHTLLDVVDHGHTLDVVDANGDGHLDIFVGEMRLDGGNADAKLWLWLGDGAGNFTKTEVATGYDNHESRIADLDGDGDLDILGKPYNFGTPRVDIWLNQQKSCATTAGEWQRQVIDESRPWRALFIMAADLDGDGRQEIISGNAWYQLDPADGTWVRHALAAPLNNAVAVYDFDNDGDNDILGSAWQDNGANPALAWARNDGNGQFSVLTNIPNGEGDFLQGVAVSHFQPDGPLEVALSWHQRGHGVQMLTAPADPSNDQWSWRMISPAGQNEALSAGDIDQDGDMDLLQGTQWLRNDGPAADSWTPLTLFATPDSPDRSRLADINQDGRLDAVVGYEAISKQGKLAWYEQPEDPTKPWREHVIAKLIGPMSLDVGDLDGDGDPDIVVGEHNLAKPATARLLTFTNVDGRGGSWQQTLVARRDGHHDGAQIARLDGVNPALLSIGWSHNRPLLYSRASTCTAAGQ